MKIPQKGLNRVELSITIVSIGVLAAVVLAPMIQNHLLTQRLRERFSEVVKATVRFQSAIELCAKIGECAKSGTLSGLAEGTLGIPHSTSSTYLDSVMVSSNGTVTAKATGADGLAGETYVLIPAYTRGAPIAWTASGTCKTRPAGAIC